MTKLTPRVEYHMSFLQIGSLNIEHLSGANRKQRAQTAYAVSEHIEMAGIDILALQEIYVTIIDDDGVRKNKELDHICELLEEHLHTPWTYKIFPKRNENRKNQLCALLWNTSKVEKTGEMKIDVDHEDGGDKLWDRAPHAIKFSMLIDVWEKQDGKWGKKEDSKSIIIIPIHMKSNYGGPTIGRRIRSKEAKTLCDNLNSVKETLKDDSIVIIGDTNCLEATEPAIEKIVDAGFIDLNNTDGTTYWSKSYGESPFDRAFVAIDRPEFKYTRQYILRSSDLQRHDRFISDHYMIKISIKTYLDDSDPRDIT